MSSAAIQPQQQGAPQQMHQTPLLFSSPELSFIRTGLSNRIRSSNGRNGGDRTNTGTSIDGGGGSAIIRPDARSPTTFRPLTAETGVLPAANGSARVCLADGSEVVVGIKAEVDEGEREWDFDMNSNGSGNGNGKRDDDREKGNVREDIGKMRSTRRRRRKGTVVVDVDVPGLRDDDTLPAYLGAMIREGLVEGGGSSGDGNGGLEEKLRIRGRFAWRIYVDILLLHSPPLSYPLPLLSLATHLALLDTRLPALVDDSPSKNTGANANTNTSTVDDDNEGDDPLFADDWGLAKPLYPSSSAFSRSARSKFSPPVILLVMAVDDNIIFDPSAQELAVADGLLAVTVAYADESVNQARKRGGKNRGGGEDGNNFDESSSSDDESSATSATPSSSRSSSLPLSSNNANNNKNNNEKQSEKPHKEPLLRLLAIRTIDPPSRLTQSGLPNALNPATGGTAVPPSHAELVIAREKLLAETTASNTSNGGNGDGDDRSGRGAEGKNNININTNTNTNMGGVWTPPRGGLKRAVVKRMVEEVLRPGGVGGEVLRALEGVRRRFAE